MSLADDKSERSVWWWMVELSVSATTMEQLMQHLELDHLQSRSKNIVCLCVGWLDLIMHWNKVALHVCGISEVMLVCGKASNASGRHQCGVRVISIEPIIVYGAAQEKTLGHVMEFFGFGGAYPLPVSVRSSFVIVKTHYVFNIKNRNSPPA